MEDKYLERLVALEQREKSNTIRLNKLEEVTEAIHSLTSDVKVLTEQLITMKADVINLKTPKQNIIFNTIATVVTSSITVAILGLILK